MEEIAAAEVFADRELAVGRPLVAHLKGRRFEQLLDEQRFERPFDPAFGKAMVKTLSYLATALGASFGFAERTELSLFAISNGGDARRLVSRIAGEAAARLSLLVGEVLSFDVHLYELPDQELALQYFVWRQEESAERAIDRYCTWVLGQSGADPSAVPHILEGLDEGEKIELLRQNALDYAQVPLWQRRGACVRLGTNEAATNGGQVKLQIDLQPPSTEEGVYGENLRASLTLPPTA